MNLDIGSGQSVTLRDRLTYGQARGVRMAYYQTETDALAKADLDIALVKAFVSSWNVLDVDGKAVPLDQPEQAPDDVIQAIVEVAAELFANAKLPKAGGDSSPTTPPELHNGSTTPEPLTSSFSTLTPVGVGES